MRFRHGAQRRRMSVGTVVTLLGTAACAPSPDQAHHTVEDYRANATLRTTVLAQCANDPGTLHEHPDCKNAKLAEVLEGVGSFRHLPPLDLPPVVPGVNDRGSPPAHDQNRSSPRTPPGERKRSN
jgi:hypothetical protein